MPDGARAQGRVAGRVSVCSPGEWRTAEGRVGVRRAARQRRKESHAHEKRGKGVHIKLAWFHEPKCASGWLEKSSLLSKDWQAARAPNCITTFNSDQTPLDSSVLPPHRSPRVASQTQPNFHSHHDRSRRHRARAVSCPRGCIPLSGPSPTATDRPFAHTSGAAAKRLTWLTTPGSRWMERRPTCTMCARKVTACPRSSSQPLRRRWRCASGAT